MTLPSLFNLPIKFVTTLRSQAVLNKSTQRVCDTFEKSLPPPTPSFLFSRLLPVQLSKPYQFKISIRGIIPEKIKSFKLKTQPQSCTQTFFGLRKMIIFPKLTIKMSCKLKCRKILIFAIYCVSYMIFNMLFIKL